MGVRALDPAHRLGDEGLGGGDVVAVGDWEVRVVGDARATAPTACRSCVPHDGSVLTGDTVLGRGTSLVAWPDGRLGDYLDSLRRLRDLVDGVGGELLPGHGPVLAEPGGVIDAYLTHRAARLAEVRRGRGESASRTPADIVAIVYADVPREVWPAAELTVRAQLEYLADCRWRA